MVTASKGDLTVSGISADGVCVLEVPEAGEWVVSATLDGVSSTAQTVAVTMNYATGLDYVSPTLNDNSWATIRAVSDAGQGENYWSVGDCKAITFNGTLGAISLDNVTLYAFILGFNHNAAIEGDRRIHFQIGKSALTGGVGVFFIDSTYSASQSGTWRNFRMSLIDNNVGGWRASQIRNYICGTSLDIPYEYTMLAVIPDELRAVLKPVTKYTDNLGQSRYSYTSSRQTTATQDYFFLLSGREVTGSSYGDQWDGNQMQYAYYADSSNSRRMVPYNELDTTYKTNWWLRDPEKDSSDSTHGWCVAKDGDIISASSNTGRGFAPWFCV